MASAGGKFWAGGRVAYAAEFDRGEERGHARLPNLRAHLFSSAGLRLNAFESRIKAKLPLAQGQEGGLAPALRLEIAHDTMKVEVNGENPTLSVAAMTADIRTRIQGLPLPNTASIRNARREFSKRLVKADPEFVLNLALSLMKLPGFEFRFIAYELVQHHRPAFASLEVRALEKLGQGMNSWAAVDCFGCYLAGPAWREHQVSASVIRRWARAKDRWWRRAALVSTVALNNKARGGVGDSQATLMICQLLVNDRDDMVVKALSWALRELSKRDPDSVREFLREHEGALASRVAREVNSKLKTGLKNPPPNQMMRG